MDHITIIRILAGLFFVVVLLAITVFFILTLYRTLSKCSPASRTMEPPMVWLLLIPLFNIVWQFLVVFAMAKSLANEFRLRNLPLDSPEPGKTLGLALCVCSIVGVIPIVNLVAGPAAFVLWILYWVKISGYSRMLGQPSFAGMPPVPPAPIG